MNLFSGWYAAQIVNKLDQFLLFSYLLFLGRLHLHHKTEHVLIGRPYIIQYESFYPKFITFPETDTPVWFINVCTHRLHKALLLKGFSLFCPVYYVMCDQCAVCLGMYVAFTQFRALCTLSVKVCGPPCCLEDQYSHLVYCVSQYSYAYITNL